MAPAPYAATQSHFTSVDDWKRGVFKKKKKENAFKNSTGLSYFKQTAVLKWSGSYYAKLPLSHIKPHHALLQLWMDGTGV